MLGDDTATLVPSKFSSLIKLITIGVIRMYSQLNKVLFASALGVLAGMLLAPAEGSKTRDKIKAKADETSKTLKEKMESAKKSFKKDKSEEPKELLDIVDKRIDEAIAKAKS
jgi:gas vesicle protein